MINKQQQAKNANIINNNIAVLDIGSNSFHLLIVNIAQHKFNILHKDKFKVGLADDLVNTGLIAPASFQLGIQTLQLIEQELSKWSINQVTVIATQALRAAKNTAQFIAEAKKVFPYSINVIDGKEEGRLIYQGVVSQLESDQSQLVIDIGGGSSEFVLGHGSTTQVINSLNIGCVSFKNRFFNDGLLSLNNFNNAIDAATAEIKPIAFEYQNINWQRCLGTSGSIESMLSVLQLMNIGDTITLHNLETLLTQIVNIASIEQLELGQINAERKHVFPSGLAILIAIFRTLKIERMDFSSADLGLGVAFEVMKKQNITA